MTVQVLWLAGAGDAAARVEDILADPYRDDLRRLLLVDDTGSLVEHSPLYERLLTSGRLDHLLCIAVGPRRTARPGSGSRRTSAAARARGCCG